MARSVLKFFASGIHAKCLSLALLLLPLVSLPAQSLDQNTPTPVRSNSVSGRIGARDLGDSRLTNHYYAFTGMPGDVLITVQSANLNGDVDVFTATSLRPLIKLTLYAEAATPVTKGIYLRKREDLILRIEARSPNDDDGTYRLIFGGSFQPIVGGPDIAEAETTPVESPTPRPGSRRVSSVGARIAEPAPPVTEVATATPEPTPEATPEPQPSETPAAKPERSPEAERPAPRTPRGRRSTTRRPPPRVRETPPPAEEPKPQPAPEPEPEIGPRLVIETNDGTLINRSMSTVRRVTVENGQVVVTGRDGKISRILLANIVRMSISP